MKVILTSALGGQIKIDGKKVQDKLLEANDLPMTIKSFWKENSKVMIMKTGMGFLLPGVPDP